MHALHQKFNLPISLVTLKLSSKSADRRVPANATGYALENISFNVQSRCRHVPSIDRGRRLACVYRPIPSSIKRVVGCSLAITYTYTYIHTYRCVRIYVHTCD